MTRNSASGPEMQGRRLIIPRVVARKRLEDRIGIGNELRNTNVESYDDVRTVEAEYRKWDDYNSTLIEDVLFANGTDLSLYGDGGIVAPEPWHEDLAERAYWLSQKIRSRVTQLESIVGRLELFPEDCSRQLPHPGRALPPDGRKVFIVHGRDLAVQQAVARFVERLGLVPVILSEQADKGKTIVEKFMEHAGDAVFALVLLTPDDEGRLSNAPAPLVKRARQNVILEFGYFLAKLGPERVCALCEGEMELPSDVSGRLYVPFDSASGGWQIRVAKEMVAAGIDVDANRLLR